MPMPDAPTKVAGNQYYGILSGRVVSLACKGRVKTRAVYKLLKAGNASNLTPAYLVNESPYLQSDLTGSNRTAVTRCELSVPALKPGQTEAQAALAAKEVNCKVCSASSSKAACPMKAGKWYSETFQSTVPGCSFSDSKGFEPNVMFMNVGTGAEIQVAEFSIHKA